MRQVPVRVEDRLWARPQVLAEARKHPLTADMLAEQFGRLGGTAYQLRRLEARIEGRPMVPLSVLGKLRHEMVRLLDAAAVELPKPRRAYASTLAIFMSIPVVWLGGLKRSRATRW